MPARSDEHVRFAMPARVGGGKYVATQMPPARLGAGTYGTVFLYACADDPSREVAIKRFHAADMVDDGPDTSLLREVSLLRQCGGHRCIVQLHDVFIDAMSCADRRRLCDDTSPYAMSHCWTYVVMERLYAPLSSVWSPSSSSSSRARAQPITAHDVRRWARQLLEALCFLHERGIVHRDVKPENLLLDAAGANVKLADFGLGRSLYVPTQRLSERCCTLWYRPPELLLGSRVYAMPVDVWSAGAVVAELAARGRPLFDGQCEFDQLMLVFRLLGTPNERTWPGCTRLPRWNAAWPPLPARASEFERRLRAGGLLGDGAAAAAAASTASDGVDLLASMLACDPMRRVTARDALRHPFFRSCAM